MIGVNASKLGNASRRRLGNTTARVVRVGPGQILAVQLQKAESITITESTAGVVQLRIYLNEFAPPLFK